MGEHKFMILGALAAAVALLIIVKKKGVAADVGAGVGLAIVDLAGGVATGVIDGVSTGIGLPTTKETITDTNKCKQYADENGYWSASAQCGLPSLVGAAASDFWDFLPSFSTSEADTKPRQSTSAFDRQ